MHNLMIANTIASGFMFAIWSKDNWYNIVIKMIFFTLMIYNILALAKT